MIRQMRCTCRFLRADALRRLNAVKTRHLQIHQDDVKALFAGTRDGLEAIAGDAHPMPGLAQMAPASR